MQSSLKFKLSKADLLLGDRLQKTGVTYFTDMLQIPSASNCVSPVLNLQMFKGFLKNLLNHELGPG